MTLTATPYSAKPDDDDDYMPSGGAMTAGLPGNAPVTPRWALPCWKGNSMPGPTHLHDGRRPVM